MIMHLKIISSIVCCRKKIEKLRASLQLLDAEDRAPNKHTFFVDSEKDVRNFDLAKHLDTHPSLLARSSNRLKVRVIQSSHHNEPEITHRMRINFQIQQKSHFFVLQLSDLTSEKLADVDLETLAGIEKKQAKAYKELQQRIDRERSLAVVQEKMEAKKYLQNKKDKPVKVVVEETKDSAPVIKFAKERKR